MFKELELIEGSTLLEISGVSEAELEMFEKSVIGHLKTGTETRSPYLLLHMFKNGEVSERLAFLICSLGFGKVLKDLADHNRAEEQLEENKEEGNEEEGNK